jgi:hypothetical protein
MKYRVAIFLVAVASVGSALAAEPAKGKSVPTTVRPLTYANVVSHFKEARLHPTEVQKRCTVFFEGEFKNADIYNYCLIIVENSDEDIQVTFYLTDAHEMNWITEFLDAPFFTPGETKKLFSLISEHASTRPENVGRYRVDFHHWQPKHAEIFVFSFTPVRSGRN